MVEVENEDESVGMKFLVGMCTFAIVTVLVLFTMFFEALKELLESSASRNMKPMISSLFGEMTILGFLNLVMYIIHTGGGLEKISGKLFGHTAEGIGYLTELFETVHYLLFMIMCLFIFKVLYLLHIATNTIQEWKELNRDVQNKQKVEAMRELYLQHKPKPWYDWSLGQDAPHRFFSFMSMRLELIRGRSTNSQAPLDNSPTVEWLPDNFDYSEYLSRCLGEYLAELIEMPPLNLMMLWVFIAAVFGIYFAVEGDSLIFSCVWVLIGVGRLNFALIMETKANDVLAHLLNPADFPPAVLTLRGRSLSKKFVPKINHLDITDHEAAPMLAQQPYWTTLQPSSKRWVVYWIHQRNQKLAAHQLSLYWLSSSSVHQSLLTLHTLLGSVYISILFAVFVPLIIREYGITASILYAMVALAPVVWE